MTTTRTIEQMKQLCCPLLPPYDYGNGIEPKLGPSLCLATQCMACERAPENDAKYVYVGHEPLEGWDWKTNPPSMGNVKDAEGNLLSKPYGWTKNVSAPVTYICTALESKVAEVEHG